MITNDIEKCVEALTSGELVAFPTETVFGLGARADSADAVSKIFDAKGRPADHPLISHCSTAEMALSVGQDIPHYAKDLADAFWPGPMTLILKSNGTGVCLETRGGHDTVAVRVPSHLRAQELLSRCEFLVAAPSANKFGRVSPTTSRHVDEEFSDILILDGDQSEVGVESTIISCLGDTPEIIREGKITAEDITAVVHNPITAMSSERENSIAAPGTLESHYAPAIPVYVFENETHIAMQDSIDPQQCAFLSLHEPNLVFRKVLTPQDDNSFAHELYAFFREAEKDGCESICVVRPPNVGIGRAINDRLSRAAHSISGQSS
jgi:L-threonylcarbamoyladenylate synthase